MRGLTVVGALGLFVVGCASASGSDVDTNANEIRSISTAEALEDFDQISASFRTLYGALKRKEARYHFDFETIVREYRGRVAASHSESEARGIFQEFVARFKDPHISMTTGVVDDASHAFKLPFQAMPVENTFVVYAVDAALGANAPVKRGDEVLSIDGTPAMDLAKGFLKYVSVANPLAAMHMAASRLTGRSSYTAQGITGGALATIKLRGTDGATREIQMPWQEVPHLLPPRPAVPAAGETTPESAMAVSESTMETTVAELSATGARVPFFMTEEGKHALGMTAEVKPSAAALSAQGLTAQAAAAVDYFATTYTTGRKKVLLVRIPDYTPQDGNAALSWLRALFADQQSQVDALVIDETHNPGGSVPFAEGLIALLAKGTFKDYVQQMHGDRRWYASFANTANGIRTNNPNDPMVAIYEDRARQVDAAYSAGIPLTAPMPFAATPTAMHAPDPGHWNKPAVMLADELSVSCADFVPLVARTNGMVKLFGEPTMGGGGNVERVATLTNTQSSLSISRGLGTVLDPTGAYPESNVIEDNGVAPDVTYAHTLADFRAGYVGYIAAFNRVVESF